MKFECELCRTLIASKVKSLVLQKTIYYCSNMISRHHPRPDSVLRFVVGSFVCRDKKHHHNNIIVLPRNDFAFSDSQNVVSSSHARPQNRRDKNKLLSRPVRKYRGVPRRCADQRGRGARGEALASSVRWRQNGRGNPRVPERAGHVQDASEATSIALRHTYAAVECSSVNYDIYIYITLIYKTHTHIYISTIKLLLYRREEYSMSILTGAHIVIMHYTP